MRTSFFMSVPLPVLQRPHIVQTAVPPISQLTPRQRDILAAMVRGLTGRDISKLLDIRQDGVNDLVRAILKKTGAANRTEAVAIALRKHLLKF